MRVRRVKLVKFHTFARYRWATGLLAVLMAFIVSLGPYNAQAMAGMDNPAEATSAMTDGHDMGAMADPCCDDCEDKDGGGTPCQNTAVCMAACGKLPLEIRTGLDLLTPLKSNKFASMANAAGSSLSLPPLRRPPKQI